MHDLKNIPKFYYSVPLKSEGKRLRVNDNISGKSGRSL